MKWFAFILTFLIATTAGAESPDKDGPHYDAGDSALPLSGGILLGPQAWCEIDLTDDDTTPEIGTLAGCGVDTGGNILFTATGHGAGVSITRFDGADVLNGMILWVIGQAATNQTTIADGGNFWLDGIDWDSPASGDPSILELEAHAQAGTITKFADATGGQVTVTSTHNLKEDQTVVITGTTSYNGTFTATNVVGTTTFEITDTWVADDATGAWTATLFHEIGRSGNVDDFFAVDIYLTGDEYLNGGGTIQSPDLATAVATGSVNLETGAQGAAGDYDSGDLGLGTGISTTAGDSGSAGVYSGDAADTSGAVATYSGDAAGEGSGTAKLYSGASAGSAASGAVSVYSGDQTAAGDVGSGALAHSTGTTTTLGDSGPITRGTGNAADTSGDLTDSTGTSANTGEASGHMYRITGDQTHATGGASGGITDYTGTAAGTAASGGLLSYTGAQTNSGDYDSGSVTHCRTGATTTDGDTGDCIAQTGVAGAGSGDAGSHIFQTHGANTRFTIAGDGSATFTNDIRSESMLYIGDTANANMTLGLTVNQSGNDDQLLAGKSSDVGHALLLAAGGLVRETDDYLAVGKANADEGGVLIEAVAEDAAVGTVFHLRSHGGTATATKSAAGRALMELYAAEHDGANAQADITADGNVFAIRARVGTADVARLIVDEDGDTWQAGSATMGGGLDMQDNDILNIDVAYQEMAASDVAADDTLYKSGNAFNRATVNTGGAPLNLAGGVGMAKATCLFASGDQTVLTFTACDPTGCTTTTVTEDTGTGGDWDCITDDNTCCSAAETYIDGLGLRFATTCVSNVLWVDPAYTMTYLALTSANGAGAGTAFVVVDGADGQILIPPAGGSSSTPALAFAADPTTGIFQASAGRLDFSVSGTRRLRLLGATAAQFAVPVEVPAAGYISFSGLTELRAPADGQTQFCNAAETNCYTFGASAPDTATLWDKAGTGAGTLILGAGDLQFSSTSYNINATAGYTRIQGALGLQIYQATDNSASGDAMLFITRAAASEMTASSGTQYGIDIDPEIDQTGTAAFIGIHHAPTDTGSGSAQDYHVALDWDADGVYEHKLQDDGDMLLHEDPGSDTPALDGRIFAANAWAQASAGAASNGANVHVAAGIRALKLQCDDPTKTNIDTVVFTVNGVAQAALVESTDFDCFGFSADQCCINLAAAIVAAAYGITPDAVTLAGTTYLTPDEDLISVDDIVIGDGEADGVGISLVEGVDGNTRIVPGILVLGAGVNAPSLRPTGSWVYLKDATGTSFHNFYGDSILGDSAVYTTTTGFIGFDGRTKWTSSGDGIWEMGINAGTQGVRFDTATTDGVLSLYDEADGALTLGANTFQNTLVGATATFGSVLTATAAATGAVDILSGHAQNAADLASGNVSLKSGDTTTDGNSGSVTVGSGAAGAGQADAGSLYLQVHGLTYASLDGATGDFILDDPGATVNSPFLYLRGDDGGTEVEGRVYFAQGAQPYLVFGVDDDSATPTMTDVLHLDDSSIRPASDGLLDLGAASNSFGDAHIDGNITQAPAGTQTVVAGDTITSATKYNPVAGNGGAVVMTSTPTIATGLAGDEVCLIGTSEANTVEVQDETTIAGSLLELNGDVDMVLGVLDMICFVFYSSHWVETGRSDNDDD